MSPLDLSLTHGQVAWALARGQPPSDQLIDQLRYLRQLGVPFSKAELGAGSGNRIRYGFDHLIELGVAVFGLERGMRPREIVGMLVDHRAEFRRLYRDTVAALPEDAFTAEWVKSRGAMVPFIKETVRHTENRMDSAAPEIASFSAEDEKVIAQLKARLGAKKHESDD